MSDYRTEVIILKYWKSKEYDRIYSVFSREYGKMRVVGIGTRKLVAKLASGLEPFTRSDIFLVKCRYLDRVTGTIVLRQYKTLKRDLDYLIEGRRTTDIVERLLPDGEANEKIFVAMKEYLKLLNILAKGREEDDKIEKKEQQNFISQLAQLSLLWKVIYWTGYFPRFSNCVYCNKKLSEKEIYQFILSQGVNCGCTNYSGVDLKLDLHKNTIKIIKFLVIQDINLVKKLKIENRDLQELKQFTKLILEQIVERRVVL